MHQILRPDPNRPCDIAVPLKSDATADDEWPRTIEVCELPPGGIVRQTALIITAPAMRQFLPLLNLRTFSTHTPAGSEALFQPEFS